MYIIHNGKIITEHNIAEGMAVVVEGETIQALIPEERIMEFPDAQLIDANGGYISPGFIDIHSDYIETIASPRPTSMMDFDLSLREAEKILISHGITTMFHSLSFYKEDVFSHKPMRNPHNIQRMVDAIEATHNRLHLIRHRLHARFEIDNIDEVEQLTANIEDGKVHLLSFMDHTPGQGQYQPRGVPRNFERLPRYFGRRCQCPDCRTPKHGMSDCRENQGSGRYRSGKRDCHRFSR